jgi:hypothetical protein
MKLTFVIDWCQQLILTVSFKLGDFFKLSEIVQVKHSSSKKNKIYLRVFKHGGP